jgi:hypothetical protein
MSDVGGDLDYYHQTFSMLDGNIGIGCYIWYYPSTDICNAHGGNSLPTVYVTATASLAETADSWYVSPPPSG